MKLTQNFTMRAIRFVVWLIGACTLAQAQEFTSRTIAGGPRLLPSPIPAIEAPLGWPKAVATDNSGNVYIGSMYSIFKLDSSGTLTHVAGSGTPGYSGDGGPALRAQFWDTAALAVDEDGNIFVSDGAGGHIRKVSRDGTVTTVAGNGSSPGFNNGQHDGGRAVDAPLFHPHQLAVDKAGNVYLSEWNTPRVRMISKDGLITTVVGTGRSGHSGDGGHAAAAEIGSAWGLAFDASGNLYIADAIPGDDIEPMATYIRKVTPDGIITTIAGTGEVGFGGDGGPALHAQFHFPGRIAVDTSGNIYVTDGSRIRRIGQDGSIRTIAGTDAGGYAGDGGPATAASISWSWFGTGVSLATDTKGSLYIGDLYNARVRKVAPDGVITTVAGNGGFWCCFSGDGGPATAAQLYVPTGIAVDWNGAVYIADTWNERIRRVSPSGIITTVAGTGVRGFSGDGKQATEAQLAWPAGLAWDQDGNLLLADSGNHRIRKISRTGEITTFAGTGASGFAGDGGRAISAEFNWPKDVTVDSEGNVYIADTGNHRIRRVSTDGTVTTVAGTGVPGFSGEGSAATSAQFNEPTGVAANSAGDVYVADTGNVRVRRISARDRLVVTVAGTGVRGVGGDGAVAARSQLQGPTGVEIDAEGRIYIADGARLLRVSPSGHISTVAGNGTIGFAGEGGPAVQAQVDVWAIAFEASGAILAAGPYTSSVRRLQ